MPTPRSADQEPARSPGGPLPPRPRRSRRRRAALRPADLELGPATRLFWRGPDTVHLELGTQGIVVEGMPAAVIRQVASPPGAARPHRGRRTDPGVAGAAQVQAALRTLADAGYLWPRHGTTRPAGLVDGDAVTSALLGGSERTPPEPQLAGELAALAVQHGREASLLLAARQHASVLVLGSSRVAPQIAALLAASGVGRVRCEAQGSVALRHAAPGGVAIVDEGGELAEAVHLALLRAAPGVDQPPLPPGTVPDLTVLAGELPPHDDHLGALHAERAAHLPVELGPAHGVVGPLVVPGSTSCLRCAHLHRLDRDPAWAAIALQLTVPSRYGATSAAALSTLIAATAAMQALAHLDGLTLAGGCAPGTSGSRPDEIAPATLGASLELTLPDWRLRRRSRPPHPSCGCGADDGAPP